MPKFSPSPETPTALDSAANCSPKKTAPPATETPTKGSTFKSCLGVQVQELLTVVGSVGVAPRAIQRPVPPPAPLGSTCGGLLLGVGAVEALDERPLGPLGGE